MADFTFNINGQDQAVTDVPEWLPMLWVLRDKLGINGPKYGCGIGACRACTCHLIDDDGSFTEFQPCVTAAEDIGDRRIRTIEGLANGDTLHPVQQAWLEMDVPQCGFCQPGQIMTATALIAEKGGEVTDDDIDAIENVCRCGTYARIRNAIKVAAGQMDPNGPSNGTGGPPDDVPPGNGTGSPPDDVPPANPGNNANGNDAGGNRGGGSGQDDGADDRSTDQEDDRGLLGGLLDR